MISIPGSYIIKPFWGKYKRAVVANGNRSNEAIPPIYTILIELGGLLYTRENMKEARDQ